MPPPHVILQESIDDRLIDIAQTMTLAREPIIEIGEQEGIGPYCALLIVTLFEELEIGADMRMQWPAPRALVVC